MVNRNGTVVLALFAFATAIAIAACSGGSSSIPGAALGGPSAQSQMHQNVWGGGRKAGPDVPSPYPTTFAETWDFNYTLGSSTKVIGKKGELVTNTTGAQTEEYVGGEYAYSLSYTTTQKNSQVVILGSTGRDVFVTYATGGSCPASDTCLEETLETGSNSFTNSNGSTGSSSYDTFPFSNFILDELVTATGAEVGAGANWNNATGYETLASDSTTDSHGNTTSESTTYIRNPDGSYTNSTGVSTPHGSWTNSSSQSSGGNASLTNNGGGPTGGTTSWGVPVPQNGRYVIPVTFSPTHGGTQHLTPNDWYPGNGPTPPLWSDTVKDLGTVTVPVKCGADAGFTAELLSERTSFVDVVAGTYSQGTIQRYVVSNAGVICVDTQRLIDAYDNYNTGNLLRTQRIYQLEALSSFTPVKVHQHTPTMTRGFTVR